MSCQSNFKKKFFFEKTDNFFFVFIKAYWSDNIEFLDSQDLRD